jgi:hypothetical protein
MEVTYSLKRRHLALACFLIESRRWINLVLCFVAGAGFAFAFTRTESPYALQAFLLLFTLFFGISWIAAVGVGVAVAGLRPGPLPGLLGRHTIEITVEGIQERTDHNRASHDWGSVVELRKSRFGQFIRLPGSYYFIPREAFPIAAEFDSFYDSASRLSVAGMRQ